MAERTLTPTYPDAAQAGISDLLAIGFGTTVAMWAVGYVGHMPLAHVPPVVFVSLMLVCLVVGGWIAGRSTARGPRGGAWVGLISATLNLLILGSALGQPHSGQLVPGAWLWVPGWFALSVLLGTVGALAGCMARPVIAKQPANWVAGFAWITCLAAMLLIAAGGLVTGFRAGMAVPDWPNTFGSNMFLYPLTQMTGGIFYEHAHRLLGTLVGSATLVLAIYLTAAARHAPNGPIGRGLVTLVWLVGVGIAVQGVFGGLRVSDDSHCLAVVHGCFAHAVLGGLVAAAVMLAREPQYRHAKGSGPCFRTTVVPEDNVLSPKDRPDPGLCGSPESGTDRFLTVLMVGVVLLQTLLGTLVRQLDLTLLTHVTLAVVVVLVSLGAGMRAWGLNAEGSPLGRLGVALVLLVVLQVSLGIVAIMFRTPPVGQSPTDEMLTAAGGRLPIEPLPALLTTAHQATAAVILGVAMALAVWTWRLTRQRAERFCTEGLHAASPSAIEFPNPCEPVSGGKS